MEKIGKNRPFVILSIDGGGSRGIIPLYLLKKLEKKLQYPLHQYFDLICGTSTGGLIALGLASTNREKEKNVIRSEKTPSYSAKELMHLYKFNIGKIFSKEKNESFVSSVTSQMIGIGCVFGLLLCVQKIRHSNDVSEMSNGVLDLFIKKETQINFEKSVFEKYFDPWIYFHKGLFGLNIPTGSGTEMKSYKTKNLMFLNSVLYFVSIFVTASVLEKGCFSGGNKENFVSLFTSVLKGMVYGYTIFRIVNLKSISPDLNLSRTTKVIKELSPRLVEKVTTIEKITPSLYYNIVDHGFISNGVTCGISGFIKGFVIGLFKKNTLKLSVRRGIIEMIHSSLLGSFSGIANGILWRIFNKHQSLLGRIGIMVLSGAMTGTLEYFWNRLIRKTVNDIFVKKYKGKNIEEVVHEYFGDRKMKTLRTNVLIPSFNMNQCKEFVFTRNEELKIREVAVSTTAAPTFFPPKKIKNELFVDGGLVSNNPALLGYAYAKQNGVKSEDIYVVSLGAGRMKINNEIKGEYYLECGELEWIGEIIDITMDGNNVDNVLRTIFDKYPKNYQRFQGEIPKSDLDDTNYQRIKGYAKKICDEEKWEIKISRLSNHLKELKKLRNEDLTLPTFKTTQSLSSFRL